MKTRQKNRAIYPYQVRKGEDELERGAYHKTFRIDVLTEGLFQTKPQWHGGKIHVYGDENLRDAILQRLSSD